jgi:hypothetical protein
MAKRTRRERRFEVEKQKPLTPKATPVEPPVVEAASPVVSEIYTPASPQVAQAAPLNNRKVAPVINFAQEYRHEYGELTTILIISGVMFAVMIGLSFVL